MDELTVRKKLRSLRKDVMDASDKLLKSANKYNVQESLAASATVMWNNAIVARLTEILEEMEDD
jgi:hypothetical protein